ncbi:MAG: hypothetical protein ACRDTT_00250 [Pseudonocardiaceae bacterium]
MSRDANEQPSADRVDRTAGNRANLPRAVGVRRAIIVLGICAVAIPGCASPERPEQGLPLAGPNPQIVTSAPPAALSPTAYQEKLRSAGAAVGPVFDRLAAAGSAEAAATELTQASTAALDAERLLNVAPPPEALAVHRDLLAGLRQLATDLSQLSGQVTSMELCAAPSILAAVSNAAGVDSLRTVRADLGSGRLGTSYQWGEFLPAATPLPDRQLANGRLLDSQRRNGRGQLKIDNDTEHDAVVKLVRGGTPIISIYVSKRSKATVEKIDDGSYELFYTSGMDWDDQLETFTRSCQFERFDEPADFTTTSITGGIQYTIMSIGLLPRIDGNALTTPVPFESFPK